MTHAISSPSVTIRRLLPLAACGAVVLALGSCPPARGQSAVKPPEGFTALFNGTDLTGWRGRPHFDPRKEAEGSPEERAKRQADWNADLAAHWKVENGVIVNDGKGVYLTTPRDYGDFELVMDWMFPVACGDSGVYLRANPQVQIWDPDCERDNKHGNQKGSGGLWNNPGDSPARFPLVKADRPIGQWNTFRIRMQGDKVNVVLNDQVVVADQPLANYFAKGEPLPARGPIQIQTHGAPMHVRNVFIRELSPGAAAAPQPAATATAADDPAHRQGNGPGWRDLWEQDFVNVNGEPGTWSWKDGVVHCTGKPVGVIRTKEPVTNLELSLEWRHLSSGGNSGVFLWAPPAALENLPPGRLPPGGIEVQVLDHGYTAQYEKSSGKKANWFTTDGDVFPVGSSSMKPFPPVAPDGRRSFPTSKHSRGTPEWNHYYIRAVDGEVKLWVNGHQVSGGSECKPATGYLCLESEGAPVEFRKLRLRELPAAGATTATASKSQSQSTGTATTAAPPAADETGFAKLFNGSSLDGWQGSVGGYDIVDGELRCRKGAGGNLLTKEEYGDFVLRFDFRLTPGANNGLGIRAPESGDAAFVGMELQILDDTHPKYAGLQPWQSHGSIYGVAPAARGALKPVGEWNSQEVTVKGSKVTVNLNGKTIVDADVAEYRDGKATPDGKAHPGLSRTKGRIGFLGHGDEVHFRNIRLKKLD